MEIDNDNPDTPVVIDGENSDTPEPDATADANDTPDAQTDPTPPAPTTDPRMADLEARLARAEEREKEYLRVMERLAPQQQAPAAEQEIDIKKWIAENTEGATATVLAQFADMIERKHARFATKDDIRHTAETTQQMAAQHEEQQAQETLRKRGWTDADIAEAKKRVWETAAKNPGKQLWRSAEAAYREMLGEITTERQFAQADKAQAAKQAVKDRQAKQITPTNAFPAGEGKIKLDLKELRKKAGRPLKTEEVLAALDAQKA